MFELSLVQWWRRRHTHGHPLEISAPIKQTSHTSAVQDDIVPSDICRELVSTIPTLQYMSDLHLEASFKQDQYAFDEIPKHAPTLLLAGDIGLLRHSTALEHFIKDDCSAFDRVLYVPGNHEFYGLSFEEALEKGSALELATSGRLTFMHRRKIVLEPDLIVLGCTLYSHIGPQSNLTNDFEQIKDWTVAKHNAEHERDREWLRSELTTIHDTDPSTEVIIATHYAPSLDRTTHPRHRDDTANLKECFASNTLEELRNTPGYAQIRAWVFGHTHYNTYQKFDHIALVSNQYMAQGCKIPFSLTAVI